jgi:hypothetical protein
MAKRPRNLEQTKQPGQISLQEPAYLYRLVPQWSIPSWAEASAWRRFVRYQPIAIVCRETLIANLLALDWLIEPRESTMRDELKADINYYTKLFNDFSGLDYAGHLSWLCTDILDLPFGGASEIGRMGDTPDGKVAWVENLDAGTLFPTLNADFPIGQRIPDSPQDVVYFPEYAIDRVYMSPRSDIRRKGWGMPPPEKIYLAVDMLSRGDKYYANLLLDTPEAGILDLGDMSKASAEDWVGSFKAMLAGVDPLKIPVLYEHENKIEFIPFGQPPSKIMYDEITMRYAAIVCAGYGMTLGDIGMSSAGGGGGDTLAGTIRSERKTKRTGLAVLKSMVRTYFNRILPEDLQFKFVDIDDEVNVNLGRARLSSANAFASMIAAGVMTEEEVRAQWIADGLVSIPISENIPPEAQAKIDQKTALADAKTKRNPDTSDVVGDPVAPDKGGWGDVKQNQARIDDPQLLGNLDMAFKASFDKMMSKDLETRLTRLVWKAAKLFYPQASVVAKSLTREEVHEWNLWFDETLFGMSKLEAPEVVKKALNDYMDEMDAELEEDDWWELDLPVGTLVALFSLAYLSGMRYSASDMARQLYIRGLLDYPNLTKPFSIENNQSIMEKLTKMAETSLSQINNGTKYYVNRIVLSKVKEAFTSEEVLSRIVDGATVEDILSDVMFTKALVSDILDEIGLTMQSRLETISEFELDRITNEAIVDEYSKVGLSTKSWECYGKNPCEDCLANRAAGYVPLSFVYQSPMGGVLRPIAHPHCECGIRFNDSELAALAEEGNFEIWYGE